MRRTGIWGWGELEVAKEGISKGGEVVVGGGGGSGDELER